MISAAQAIKWAKEQAEKKKQEEEQKKKQEQQRIPIPHDKTI